MVDRQRSTVSGMMSPMADYRVNLDIYNGPLDLLLYLIRREEVDIHDIPIARITRQYVEYVDLMKQLDPNLAGEFLVFAATLMEIKTRMLLPEPPPEEGGSDTLELDPRAELVRQLLEYKAFKDAAGDLHEAAIAQSLRHPRKPGKIEGIEDSDKDLEDVQIWDLFDAFTKILEAIGSTPRLHEVVYDDTPVELHAADILDRLYREGPLDFGQVFEGRTRRIELVGLFIAMLELVRQKKILVTQEGNFGHIRIELHPNPPADAAVEDNVIQAKSGAQEQAQAPDAPAEWDETDEPDGQPQDEELETFGDDDPDDDGPAEADGELAGIDAALAAIRDEPSDEPAEPDDEDRPDNPETPPEGTYVSDVPEEQAGESDENEPAGA